jgi:hypothetical protein
MTPREKTPETEVPQQAGANPGFALGQLAKAYATSQTHPHADTRERAESKVASWIKVFQGMLSGTVHIGSDRSPRQARELT